MSKSVLPRAQNIIVNFAYLPSSLLSYLQSILARILPAFTPFKAPPISPPPLPNPLPACRYRRDNDSSARFLLSDGRQLGYAEYGSAKGRPIIFLHGIPGSRLDAASLDEVAKRLDARIISPDRSGIGWSSPHAEGTVLSHVADLMQLVEHLKVEEYGVMGVSGGGPYALACAYSMPSDKLKAVSIVCGLGPPDIGYWGMQIPNWLGFTIAHRYRIFEPGVQWYASRETLGRLDIPDDERLRLLRDQFFASRPHERDLAVFKDNFDYTRLFLRSTREHFVNGYEAFSQDGRLLSTDFGFRVEDIREDLVVQLWYGRFDTNVPVNHGVQIAKRLGGRARLRVEDETHASLQIRYRDEILEDLVRSL